MTQYRYLFIGITYLALALFAYGIILFILRNYFHRYYSRIAIQKQTQLLKTWHNLLLLVKVSLIGLPICFLSIIIILSVFESIPYELTVPPLFLLYINIFIIYIDRRWHVKALTGEIMSQTINRSNE
jgi:hypothetical protein